jgi:hypothetical protein
VAVNRSTRREVRKLTAAELSPQTFCAFAREFPAFQRQGRLLTGSDLIPDRVPPHPTRATYGPGFSRLRLQTFGAVASLWSEPRSALYGHAVASTDGHLSHDAVRLETGPRYGVGTLVIGVDIVEKFARRHARREPIVPNR